MSHPGSGSFGVARQIEIYQRGSQVPVAPEALEQRARELLSPEAFGYLAGGAGAEDTMRANLAAFRRWRIEPRVLCNLASREWRSTLLGTNLPAPVLLAPLGVQGILHPDGELASARAAAALGIPVILSSVTSRTPTHPFSTGTGSPITSQTRRSAPSCLAARQTTPRRPSGDSWKSSATRP